MACKGFTKDTYVFLMELGLNNNKTFFEQNRDRYQKGVREPMTALAQALIPTALKIDPNINTKMNTVLSRIYRDARRTHGVDPYRNNAWMTFRPPQVATEECFCMYFEISTEGYGYGMGTYAANSALMATMRAHILSDPARFLSLANAPAMSRFTLEGEAYKKDHFPDAPDALKPYLNRKNLSWCFFSDKLSRTMDGNALYEEVKTAMEDMAALYQYLTFKTSL
ncbi:MAG: DUF2461 domain-containing protein [Clostridia bacterium]|nr:DUF2461 domain-containing protein [Clostridia bacterium]